MLKIDVTVMGAGTTTFPVNTFDEGVTLVKKLAAQFEYAGKWTQICEEAGELLVKDRGYMIRYDQGLISLYKELKS